MIYVVACLIGSLIGATGWAVAMHRAWKFSQEYAVRKSEEYGITTIEGAVYSDMATVMVLALDKSGREMVHG